MNQMLVSNSNVETGRNSSVFIIAEIGKNFIQTKKDVSQNEYLKNAKELALLAKKSGADAVKFQTHTYEDEQLNIDIIAPHFSGSDRYAWVKRNSKIGTKEFWKKLKNYCDKIGIIFFSTPMSRGAAKILEEINVPLWKIGSGDILDFVMLDYITQTGKSIIMSTGMSTQEEIDKSVAFIKKRTDKLVLLHCVSKYPCPKNELYLDTITFLSDRYKVPVGFSDHSIGYDAAIAAISKGAIVIEKHLSKSRDLWGSDHKVSMTQKEFSEMVKSIRLKKNISSELFGKGVKELDNQESQFRPVFRKSLMAGCDIKKGSVITKNMLYAMRPQKYAKGIVSEEYESVIGKRIIKSLKKYEPIINDILE